MRVLTLTGFAAVLSASSSASFWGFEDYIPGTGTQLLGSGANYWTYGAGSNALPGWTLNGRSGDISIDVVNGSYSHNGNYGVDLAGTTGPGSLSRSLATGAGAYELSFYANFTGATINSLLYIDFGTYNNMVTLDGTFKKYTFTVTPGASGSTFLQFATDITNHTNGNLFIDDISLNPVPEPMTLSLIGLAALVGYRRVRRSRLG